MKKEGFTLIELVFAIVVLSIVVISIPIISKTNMNNIQKALIQEAILGASSKLANVSSYVFDVASLSDLSESDIERVIGSNCNTRSGLVTQPFHRRCTNSVVENLSKSSSNSYPSIENGVVTNADLFLSDGSKEGYKSNYSYTLGVTYPEFDVKKLTATIQKDGEDLVVLKSFVANIGEAMAYKRIIQ